VKASLLLLAVLAILGVCAPSARAGPGSQEIRLIWLRTSVHPHGKHGSWTSRLVNEVRQFARPAGTRVGGEVGFSHGSQYVGAIKLPGGVLEYSGKTKRLPNAAGFVVPVVDGSGVFAGVTGTYTLYTDGDKTHPHTAILVLRLRYG
jgi:hypothetical protein